MDINSTYGKFTDKDFKNLSDFIYSNYGINLYPNKKILVKSRLLKRLKVTGIKSYSEYCDFVLNHDTDRLELVEMINQISTNKTDFFRESKHFDFLSNMLTDKFLNNPVKQDITLWSAGCSSGEEPYTIGMVLENIKETKSNFNYQIFASDISTDVLKHASRAIYSYSVVNQIPQSFRSKYLLKSKDKLREHIRITAKLRNRVEFFRYNLLNPKSAIKNPVDIIFCRNTLIYFDRQTQEKVVKKLLNSLKKSGYLFLGHSESLINMKLPLLQVGTSIYQKV